MKTFEIKGVGWVTYDKDPDHCSICDRGQVTQPLGGFMVLNKMHHMELVYQCSSDSCSRLFIGRYRGSSSRFELVSLTPCTPKPPTITDEVRSVSSMFCEIYEQASAAEKHGLNQVAGIGYRKAFEFLIKDYCISICSEKAESIKSAALGQVIQEYIDHPDLKDCAERAAWLGNDETHYVRKWENKDVNDLKALIEISCSFIHMKIRSKAYISSMQKKSK